MKTHYSRVLYSLVLSFSVAGLLPACGSKNSDKDGFAQVQENRLEREWIQMACTNSGDLAAFGASRKVSLLIAADKSLSRVETYYSAGNCTNPAVTVTYNGTYTKEAENDQDGNIDFNNARVVLRAINDSGLSALRSLNWCGQTEWYLGVDVDVTNAGRSSSCIHPAMPLTTENRYRVEQEVLFLGTSALSANKTRPTTVNRADPFHCPCPH